ncbi:unnamed protein product [marine sediment metagenome]|uniref:Uncharacterized protein n=1 Tax=marine sediment metagenome TaxID=412755 RepID=X1L4C1_9ZZZZ
MSEVKRSFDGVWTLEGDELHLDIPQLLLVSRLENTQENRDLAVRIAAKLAANYLPYALITITRAF